MGWSLEVWVAKLSRVCLPACVSASFRRGGPYTRCRPPLNQWLADYTGLPRQFVELNSHRYVAGQSSNCAQVDWSDLGCNLTYVCLDRKPTHVGIVETLSGPKWTSSHSPQSGDLLPAHRALWCDKCGHSAQTIPPLVRVLALWCGA